MKRVLHESWTYIVGASLGVLCFVLGAIAGEWPMALWALTSSLWTGWAWYRAYLIASARPKFAWNEPFLSEFIARGGFK